MYIYIYNIYTIFLLKTYLYILYIVVFFCSLSISLFMQICVDLSSAIARVRLQRARATRTPRAFAAKHTSPVLLLRHGATMFIGVLHVGMQGSRLKQQEFSLFSLKIQKLLTLQPICLRQQLLQSGSTSPLLTSSQLFSTLLGSSQLFTLALLTSSQLFNSSLLFSALLSSSHFTSTHAILGLLRFKYKGSDLPPDMQSGNVKLHSQK